MFDLAFSFSWNQATMIFRRALRHFSAAVPPASDAASASGGTKIRSSNSSSTIPKMLQKIRATQPLPSIYTEQTRYIKSLVAMWENKIINEFPSLKKYSMEYQRNGDGAYAEFVKRGQIYVGADKNDRHMTDNGVSHLCEVRVNVDEKLKSVVVCGTTEGTEDSDKKVWHKFQLLVQPYLSKSEDNDGKLQTLVLRCERFPTYAENKKFLVDTLSTLVKCSQDLSRDSFENISLVGSNEEQQTAIEDSKPVAADIRNAFPEEWVREDMANGETERVKELRALAK